MRKGGESRELSLLGRKQTREDVDAKREEDAMSLGKRKIGRRVAGVGVAVAMMVLGLAAPASAVPAVTAAPSTVQLPKTATDAELRMILGVILIIFSLTLFLFNRRQALFP